MGRRIRSEMTGGIKIVSEQNLGSYVTLHPTNTTNTFTPTTLKTIEQMFVDVEEPESYKNQAGFAPPALKHKTYINMDSSNWQQGGVTTVVTPSAAPPPSFELLQPTSTQEEEKKVNRGGGRKPRDKEEESLNPEEEERRRLRRERNKLAAARCRKRRVDQTETLQEEVNMWENKKKAMQDQIQQLQEEKTQLAFILEAHKSVCSRVSSESALDVKPICTTSEPRVLVKAEPEIQQSTVRHLTHAEAMEEDQQVTVTTTVRLAAHQKPKRPSSLLVGNGSNSLSSLNIPIETPTNVMNQLDFNALMDGRTGLTPTNILTPIMVKMTTPSSSGFLQTPTVSTPSCGSQQRTSSGRGAVMQELGSPSAGAHLVSL